MKKRGKIVNKGLSPIIATVLLISIAVVLAAIIAIWAYSFVGESVTKQGSAIEQVCEEVQFEAEADGGILRINNLGDVPLWGVEVRKKETLGDITNLNEFSEDGGIKAGETISVGEGLSGELIVSPILLGETERERKKYICDERFGQRIEI